MAGKRRARNESPSAGATHNYTSETFAGVGINSDGSQPITRHTRPATQPEDESESAYKRNRRRARENLKKTEHDMHRRMLEQVGKAIERPIKLPFRMSDFMKARSKIPIHARGPFGDLVGKSTELKAENGPAVLVDLDDVVVFWYFPEFIGTGLRTALLASVTELAKVYCPTADAEIKDRRKAQEANEPGGGEPGVTTRSQAARVRAQAQKLSDAAELGEEAPELGEEPAAGSWSEPEREEEGLFAPPAAEIYTETEGDIRWRGSDGSSLGGDEGPPGGGQPESSGVDDFDLSSKDPFAYYLTPGWYATAQEMKGHIVMSKHFQEALADKSAQQTIALLESKRLYDNVVNALTEIIHPSLNQSLHNLRACMAAVKGPTQVVLENGWPSNFPCFGVGVNRTSTIHRDSKGISAGVDVIGVLGTFTTGGKLELPDLNFTADWIPGCLGAFDGYDFRHNVHRWGGGSRVAFISFCRKSTWTGLNLDPTLSRPTLSDVRDRLASSTARRLKEVHDLHHQLKAQQEADRQAKIRQKEIKLQERLKEHQAVRQEKERQHEIRRRQQEMEHRVREIERRDRFQHRQIEREDRLDPPEMPPQERTHQQPTQSHLSQLSNEPNARGAKRQRVSNQAGW